MSRTSALALIAAALTFAPPAHAAPDGLESYTGIGSDALMQALRVRRHIMKEEATDAHGNEIARPARPSDWIWTLGYGYQRATREDVAEAAHSFELGLEWETLDDLDLGVRLALESVPDAELRAGSVNLAVGYVFDLDEEPEAERVRDQDPVDDDAPSYKRLYGKAVKLGMQTDDEGFDEDDPIIDDGPTLLVRGLWSWQNHLNEITRTLLEGRWAGLELVYTPKHTVAWRFHFSHHFYDEETPTGVDDFVATFASPAGYNRLRPRRSPTTGLFSPQRGFPLASVELSASLYPSDWWEVCFGAAHTAYKPSTSFATLNFGGAAFRSWPVSRWRVGAGVDLSVASDVTAFLGSVLLAYKF